MLGHCFVFGHVWCSVLFQVVFGAVFFFGSCWDIVLFSVMFGAVFCFRSCLVQCFLGRV